MNCPPIRYATQRRRVHWTSFSHDCRASVACGRKVASSAIWRREFLPSGIPLNPAKNFLHYITSNSSRSLKTVL